jgi:hypothetical protein
MQINIEKLERRLRRMRSSASALEAIKRLDSWVASIGWVFIPLANHGKMRREMVTALFMFSRSFRSVNIYRQTSLRPGFTLFLITVTSGIEGEKTYREFWSHEFVVKKGEAEWERATDLFRGVRKYAQRPN